MAIVLVVFAAFSAPRPTRATVMVALDLHQLVGRADQIFVGKVLQLRSRWTNAGSRRRIVTDATVVVERDVRGTRVGEKVVVTRLGGTVNGIGMRVSGVAVLRKGQQVLLFTEARPIGRAVVGMRQGAFALETDSRGVLVLKRSLEGLSFVDRKPDSLKLSSISSLEQMVRHVRTAIVDCRKTPQRCMVAPQRIVK